MRELAKLQAEGDVIQMWTMEEEKILVTSKGMASGNISAYPEYTSLRLL